MTKKGRATATRHNKAFDAVWKLSEEERIDVGRSLGAGGSEGLITGIISRSTFEELKVLQKTVSLRMSDFQCGWNEQAKRVKRQIERIDWRVARQIQEREEHEANVKKMADRLLGNPQPAKKDTRDRREYAKAWREKQQEKS
jgi:hypothetical protein